jgi:hypothetical protein
MMGELEGCGRKWSWPNSRKYSNIYLEGLRETKKTSVWIASLEIMISTLNLLNKKQKC